MRRRTADFLQGNCSQSNLVIILTYLAVLRRARPENEEKERKTASGRTFKVQGS
jgi:actin related protein 2/3 complex subunit 2